MKKLLYIVGIGPGEYEQMTMKAARALKESHVIVGYTVYTDLIKAYFPDKDFLSTPMLQEVERCRMALEEANKGRTVSIVCSGDPGVYGMAGLVLELAKDYDQVEIQVISGVTAALSGAALLGGPLTHDFAVISLSDLLTPMDLIVKRLKAAGTADFVICIYNPSSKKRADYLRKACGILLEYRSEETICGVVRNIGRAEESGQFMTLGELKNFKADMFTTVFIGNSQTRLENGRMVTPRGYQNV